jgi:hypothetical protein
MRYRQTGVSADTTSFAVNLPERKRTSTPPDILAKYTGPIPEAIRRAFPHREFLDLCDELGGSWTAAFAK